MEPFSRDSVAKVGESSSQFLGFLCKAEVPHKDFCEQHSFAEVLLVFWGECEVPCEEDSKERESESADEFSQGGEWVGDVDLF